MNGLLQITASFFARISGPGRHRRSLVGDCASTQAQTGPFQLVFGAARGCHPALCGYAFLRRSLTPWIFAGMLVGAEVGHDSAWHIGRTDLQVLSAIFLRLIKTIIAPLIFSTLVVGIAGHSNLKQVGRMGIKALLYFEVVTTIALFIGLGAINFTQRGRGRHSRPPTLRQPQSLRRHKNGQTTDPARVSGKYRQVGGRRPGAAGGGVQHYFRHCAGLDWRREAPSHAGVLREPLRDDVQVHQHRDAVCAHRRGRRHGLYRRHHGTWRDGQPAEAAAHALRRAGGFRAGSAASGRADCPRADQALRKRRGGAGDRSPLPRPVQRPRCHAPWRRWKPLACRGRSWLL